MRGPTARSAASLTGSRALLLGRVAAPGAARVLFVTMLRCEIPLLQGFAVRVRFRVLSDALRICPLSIHHCLVLVRDATNCCTGEQECQ